MADTRQVTKIPGEPPVGRRQRNKNEKLQRITRAARALFHRQGFDQTTTAQIAKAAGVGEGTLFLYVAQKEDLLILAFTSEMAEVVTKAAAAVDRRAESIEQLMGFFDELLAFHEADPILARSFLREVGFLRNPERDYGFGNITVIETLADIVERARSRGAIAADIVTDTAANLLFSAYWFCLRGWAHGEMTAAQFRDRLREMLQLALRGMTG